MRALRRLAPVREPEGIELKTALRQAAQDAIGLGVLGMPTLGWGARHVWGEAALPMPRAALEGGWFERETAVHKPGSMRRRISKSH